MDSIGAWTPALLALGGCRQPRGEVAELLFPAPAGQCCPHYHRYGPALAQLSSLKGWAQRMAPPSVPRGVFLGPSTKYVFFKRVCFCYLVGDMDFWGWEKRDNNVKRGGRVYNQQDLKQLNTQNSTEDPARAARRPSEHYQNRYIYSSGTWVVTHHMCARTCPLHSHVAGAVYHCPWLQQRVGKPQAA